MSPSPTRLDLRIDVFEKSDQRALVLAELKPADLVAAAIEEFRELEYLEDVPDHYRLLKLRRPLDEGASGLNAGDLAQLEEGTALREQLEDGDRLVLQEVERPLPEGTRRPEHLIYLREQAGGKTFRIPWVPAIIGRTSENLPQNDRVAVDLKSFPAGLRVSRRHLVMTEEDGSYFIEGVSSNPAWVIPASPIGENREGAIPLMEGKLRIYPGDVIRLERSDISLKFLQRPAAGRAGQQEESGPDFQAPAAAGSVVSEETG